MALSPPLAVGRDSVNHFYSGKITMSQADTCLTQWDHAFDPRQTGTARERHVHAAQSTATLLPIFSDTERDTMRLSTIIHLVNECRTQNDLPRDSDRTPGRSGEVSRAFYRHSLVASGLAVAL
jgi:hypothetical protein